MPKLARARWPYVLLTIGAAILLISYAGPGTPLFIVSRFFGIVLAFIYYGPRWAVWRWSGKSFPLIFYRRDDIGLNFFDNWRPFPDHPDAFFLPFFTFLQLTIWAGWIHAVNGDISITKFVGTAGAIALIPSFVVLRQYLERPERERLIKEREEEKAYIEDKYGDDPQFPLGVPPEYLVRQRAQAVSTGLVVGSNLSPRDWWKKRRSIPTTRGHLRTPMHPDAPGHIKVAGGREQSFRVAAAAIADFEQSVANLQHSSMELGNIELREGYVLLPQKIPLCQDPNDKYQKIPSRFRSLGVKVNKSFFYEYWFLIRIELDETGFLWRMDHTSRDKKRGIIFKLCLAILCWSIATPFFVAAFSSLSRSVVFESFFYPCMGGSVLVLIGLGAFALGTRENGGEAEYFSHLKVIWGDTLETIDFQELPPPQSSPSAPSSPVDYSSPSGSALSASMPNQTQRQVNRPRSKD